MLYIKMGLRKASEYDREIPQSHTNPWHREEEPQNIYSSNASVR